MTRLRQRMLEDMQIRSLSPHAQASYPPSACTAFILTARLSVKNLSHDYPAQHDGAVRGTSITTWQSSRHKHERRLDIARRRRDAVDELGNVCRRRVALAMYTIATDEMPVVDGR